MSVVLGVDFGTKRIGLAVSDPDRVHVFPRETLRRGEMAEDLATLRQLCEEDAVELIALGLPLNADGSEGGMCTAARQFGARLVLELGLDLVFVDERYSSIEADERLRELHPRDPRRRRQMRDRAAAAIILRSFLEAGAYE